MSNLADHETIGHHAPAHPGRLVVLNDFAYAKGGASSLALENAKLAAGQGWQVTFIAAQAPGQNDLAEHGVQCLGVGESPIDPKSPMGGMAKGLYNAACERFLRQWMDRNDTAETVYHLHGWSKIFSPSIFRPLSQRAERVIVHAHDYFPACPNGAFINYPKAAECPYLPTQLNCLTANCDQRSYPQKVWRVARHWVKNQWFDLSDTRFRIVLPHEAMRPYFVRSGCDDDLIHTIPNPVRPFLPARIAAEKQQRFAFIGRVVPEKGVDLFLQAARTVGVAARVIGDGPQLEALKSRHPEAEFVGWQDKTTIQAHLTDVRAVVMPSRLRETFGLVAVEALGSGLPVVVSTSSAIAGQVASLDMGLSVPSGDLEALSQALHRLAESDDLVATMSHNGFSQWKAIASTNESWTAQLCALYEETIEGDGP
ncbi:MAG: glycosyltransferase family 4 protein [Burkholderiaceae bacterium]